MRRFIITEEALLKLMQTSAVTALQVGFVPRGPIPDFVLETMIRHGGMEEIPAEEANGTN